ncbi:MAG TPA: hypothetical protein VEQ10_11505 [Vicinamibacteria bacterium]|nr:hypothetical protein [Vicinamibacteria bacterium]
MNEEMLSKLREEPRPEFAEALQQKLRSVDAARREARLAAPRLRLWPALAGATLVVAVALAFTLEPVRAAARDFLDLFRVKRFAAVPVDPERLANLQQGGLDLKSLVADQVETRVAPEKPVAVANVDEGALEADITAQLPTTLPAGYALSEVSVGRPGAFRVRLDATRLQQLAQAVGADEIEIPASWNGASVDVAMPPVLVARYERAPVDGVPATSDTSYLLFQSKNPAVELPEGVELSTLGRLALRTAGMSAAEAETFANAVDWRATLLVPVSVRGGAFREVEVNGQKGLLVTGQPAQSAAPGGRVRSRSVLMWATGEKVFAIHGPGGGIDLLAMAQSIR